MSKPKWKVPDRIRAELDATGLPWTAESGKKHIHLVVAGKRIGVISRGEASAQLELNMCATIRRAARDRKQAADAVPAFPERAIR